MKSVRLLFLTIFVLNLISCISSPSHRSEIEYNYNLWNKSLYYRFSMLSDIKQNILKIGMSKKDVIKLLGDPDAGMDLNNNNEHLYYKLGEFSMWITIFDLEFVNDKLVKYRVYDT